MATLAHPDRRRFSETIKPKIGAVGVDLRKYLPLTLLLYSILLPYEVRAELSGQIIYPYRAVIILSIIWILKRLRDKSLRLHLFDIIMFIGALWIPISFVHAYGVFDGTLRGASITLDVGGSYLIARLTIANMNDLRRVLILFAPGIFISATVLAIESVTHVRIIKPWAQSIFGMRAGLEGIAQKDELFIRLGLLRASGPFAHPILAGLVLTSAMAIYLSSGLRKWPWYAGVASGLLSFFTVSSAALLGLLIVFAATAFDRINRFVTFVSWRLVLVLGSVALTVVHFASQNGIVSILIRFTLDPQTGYYRKLTWTYGSASVAKNPLFGIALAPFDRAAWMSTSIDTYWLAVAVRHGLIVPIAFLLCAVLVLYGVAKRAGAQPSEIERRAHVGLAISLFTITLLGFTVSYYGGALVWYFALLGICGSIAAPLSQPRALSSRVQTVRSPRRPLLIR